MASSSGLTPTGFTAQDVKDLEAGIPFLLKEHLSEVKSQRPKVTHNFCCLSSVAIS